MGFNVETMSKNVKIILIKKILCIPKIAKKEAKGLFFDNAVVSVSLKFSKSSNS